MMKTKVCDLLIGNKFQFDGDTKVYIYIGIHSYNRIDYMVYLNGRQPYIKLLNTNEDIII